MTFVRQQKTPGRAVGKERRDTRQNDRRESTRKGEAVRSAVSFYKKTVKREDVRGIMEDLSKL